MNILKTIVVLTCLFVPSSAASQQVEQKTPAVAANSTAANDLNATGNPSGESTGGFGFLSGTGDIGGFGGGLGGGFGGEVAMGLPASAIPSRKWVAGSKVIVAVSDDDTQVWAYCEQHPQWVPQALEPKPGVAIVPVIGDLAAVRHGNHCYAYSSTLGIWDALRLPEGEVAIPAVSTDSVSVHSTTQGDFVFQDSWGKWFSAEEIKVGKVAEFLRTRQDTALAQQTPGQSMQEIRVFHLQYIKASEAARMLQQLYEDDIYPFVDERTNSLLVSYSDPQALEQVEAVLLKFDSPKPAGGQDLLGSQQSVVDLRKLYDELQQKALELAGQARNAVEQPVEARKLRNQLRAGVRRAFEVQQQLQRAELAEFARRLEEVKHSLETRALIGDQIIDRRVEELLDPKLKWDDPVVHAVTPVH